MRFINSITEFQRLVALPEPLYPLVSVVRLADMHFGNNPIWEHFSLNFYCVSMKKGITGKAKYGQQYYDFDKGLMTMAWGMRFCSTPIFCINTLWLRLSRIMVSFPMR